MTTEDKKTPRPRISQTITFSLPPEMARQVQQVMREEHRTMSDLVREALRTYMEEREWRRTARYERLRDSQYGSSDPTESGVRQSTTKGGGE